MRGVKSEKPLKPAAYSEACLLQMILDGELKPGDTLPGERDLAGQLGITRPTLRETLQRMAREGWFCIRHGKPTTVNDYLQEGGLQLLATLVAHGDALPEVFITHFMRVRVAFMPFLARKTVEHHPEALEAFLEKAVTIDTVPEMFMAYDWALQRRMATLSGNPIYRMILNDFNVLYQKMGTPYFATENGRKASLAYYGNLLDAVRQKDADKAASAARHAMEEAIEIWRDCFSHKIQ